MFRLSALRLGRTACVLLALGATACGDDENASEGRPDAATDAARSPADGRADGGDHEGGVEEGGRDAANGEDGATDGPDEAVADARARPDVGSDAHGDAGDGAVGDRDFYPLADGAEWVYRHSGGSTVWDETVQMGAIEHDGAAAFLLRDTPGPSGTRSESVLVALGTRVSRVYREEFEEDTLKLTASYDPGFVRFDRSWRARAPGYTEVLTYHRTETDGAGAETADGERSHRFTVESISDSIDVPVGRFEDCVRIRRTRIRPAGAVLEEGDDDQFWFCPGVGKVREEDLVTGKLEELVRCTVPDGACPVE